MNEANDANPSEIEQQLSSVTAVITGALAKPQENVVKAMGTIVQRGLQHNLMLGFKEAWQHLEKEGRVKSDYLSTFHGAANFKEVLHALELDDTDQARFEAVQNIFLHGALLDDDRNEVLTTRLLKTAVQLSAGEIIVLRKLVSRPVELKKVALDTKRWEAELARLTGLKHVPLVCDDIVRLQQKNLLTTPLKDIHGEPGIPTLTSLGRDLCEYMENLTHA